ncbi:unnamed protein product [Trypanosoma congolense IL3000]|uniref:WGS project CAEQ00000000 data, annotated contig 2437 n=1 Tax=Trypanosoma congolense (strain IL3000) TaxID=1068625 RepID=F9WE44_TRYCI|nr:unnamed protein product [Trypanosoma congolense IL3000]
MEGRGAKRTRDETEGEAVAPVVQAPARGEVTTATDAVVRHAAVSHEHAVRPSGRWTLDSPVKEVLLEDCAGLSDMSLHDFLMKHFGETFGSPCVSMRVFMGNPSFFLRDESLLTMVTESEPYREYVERYNREYELYKTMREGVDRLSAKGIYFLHQWESAAAANEVEDVDIHVKGKLNGAVVNAKRSEEAMRVGIAPSGVEIDGAYDAVFNARWSYVVMSDEYSGKWLGMGVLDVAPGEQPHLWSEAQADVPYDPEEPWEGDEVPGVSGKLVMAVLSSERGWPYGNFQRNEMPDTSTLTEYDAACDAYIRRENLRVWHIVEKNIGEWLRDRGYVHPFIVIGTPGIGKSFATGSLLLYQLLHYPSDDLKVVAYFVEGKAYIFHREERRVVYYEEQRVALRNVNDIIRRGVKGYIIFDISENSVHIGDLPYPWGIVLISSPNVKKYHEFTKRRQDTLPIYMNCYEDAEFKAALVRERHWKVVNNRIRFEDVNLENDWKVLKKRIDMVGPLPRYVLAGQATYEKRVSEVETALRLMRDELGYYMRVLDNPHEWYEDGTTHKLVKLVRCEVKGKFECRNRVTSIYVLKELARKLRAAHLKVNLTYHILCGALEKCACLLEELSLDIFTLREAVDTLVKHLEHLPRGNEAKRESVLCQRGANGRVPTALSEFASDSPRQKLVTGRIYKPLATNFPLVDGFFVVEGVGLKTIVLVQVTKAKEHHTKKTTVNAFREYMGKVFEDWENIEKAYTWELIYVQHVDSTAIKKRQNCSSSGDAANDTDLALWDRIHQYQVTLSADIASEFINPSGGTRMA